MARKERLRTSIGTLLDRSPTSLGLRTDPPVDRINSLGLRATWAINGFRNCCGVVEIGNLGVSSVAIPLNTEKRQGLTIIAFKSALLAAKNSRYSYAVCTEISSSKKRIEAVEEAGFQELSRTKNSKTGNTIVMFGRKLSNLPFTW